MEAGRSDAPALVLLHGVGANSMHWRYQLAGLSDRYHVVAWNAPGYILSDALKTDDPTCETFANALNDFLAAVNLDRVNLVGNSFGSRVAQCFALYYPGRIIKLAMTGTGIGPHNMSKEKKSKIIATRQAQIAKGGYAFGMRVNALLAAGASPQTIELVSNVVRATNARGFMHGIKLGLADGYSPEEIAPKLDFPVLLISGREAGSTRSRTTLLSWSRSYQRANLRSSTASATFPGSNFPIPSTRCCGTSLAEQTPTR